ncbi:MAG TPA: acyl carrier protein [Lachnospiraceae bacterium]|nr:acyl carrier protein [Lachnospiraceae bacterium]
MTDDQVRLFKDILARYSSVDAEDISDEMRFREDLQMSSLDFMTLLGDLEDEFDIEFEDIEDVKLYTVGEATEYLGGYL